MQDSRTTQRRSSYDLFSDFEDTIVVPEISYKDWVLPRVAEREKFEAEYERRRARAKTQRSKEAWENYLNLYSKLFSINDFKDIAMRYSMNRIFQSWCKKFLKAHDYEKANLTVVTRGLVPIVKNYFGRPDAKAILSDLGISLVGVIGSEPSIDNQGLMKGLKSVIYSKRKFVRDGHVMLGDDGDEWEFGNYSYFVNLSKLKGGE